MFLRPSLSFVVAVVLSVQVQGCDESHGNGPRDDAAVEDGMPEGFIPGPEATWTLQPGEEAYLCVYQRVTEDMLIDSFRALTPTGTHHSLLTVLDEVEVIDTSIRCTPQTLAPRSIYGAGVGTEPLELPEGTAVALREGQQLLLNLHLFNTSDRELTGRSGVYIRPVEEASVDAVAEARLVGTSNFEIPPMATGFSARGSCTQTQATTIFAILPHMHWYGVAMNASVTRADGETIRFFESSYSFDDQRYTLFEPIHLEPGDRVDVECLYDNPTSSTITYGDSSREEMCFGAVFSYPAADSALTCID